MYKVFLLGLFLMIPSIFAQEDGGEGTVTEFYFDADSNEPENERTGEENHPYKYLSEFTEPASGSIKLYFYSANSTYQYNPNSSKDTILTLSHSSTVIIAKYDAGTVIFDGTVGNKSYARGIVISPGCSIFTLIVSISEIFGIIQFILKGKRIQLFQMSLSGNVIF